MEDNENKVVEEGMVGISEMSTKEMLYNFMITVVENNQIRDFNVLGVMEDFVNGMKLLDNVSSEEILVAEEVVENDASNAIQDDFVVCLECGKQFSQLTGRHLASHGLTMDQYKKKWGFKKTQKMISLNASKKRSKAAKKRGVPEGLQNYLNGRKAKKEASEPVVEKKTDEVAAEQKPSRSRRRQPAATPVEENKEAKTE